MKHAKDIQLKKQEEAAKVPYPQHTPMSVKSEE